MESTGEERSLASGIPIPQWMRTKTENHGFDPSTLSPPTHESDFFYIKFPGPKPTESSNMRSLNEVLQVKEKAFTKHTDPCKQFIPKIQETVQVQKQKIIKPMGVDDGFKGEGAACGASVVEVAHQILMGKDRPFKPLNRGDTEGSLTPTTSYLQKRRDSKSLPVSPVASPESSPLARRKNKVPLQNRLFGGTFLASDNNLNESDEEGDKKSGSSWILSSLFSGKKETGKEEGDDKSLVSVDSNSKKLSKYKRSNTSEELKESVNMTVEIKAISPQPVSSSNKGSFLKSKPHLRDLNFLSPTSM